MTIAASTSTTTLFELATAPTLGPHSTFLLLISPLKNLAVNVCMASFKQNGYDATIGPVLDFAYMPVFGERPTR
eukprot:CAMPEP_0177157874 /NCGR_PEP_ID=MMETSP0367-20130122/3496_1 /TAXON_ID=447022 ORGANISM="Scrippsiella hangoei-like, Strain SHHI-4" /NCGR_SAMPLE_ID=MMETSP0367 /ASSEMBLY_ACC=CAM_ASM_000362 /LENGTH=73 /DNA_ID=CAMNT_0018603431 /DNA_START=239 /DNA_END=458 /DNA_ORIENTATION=-